MTAVDFCLFSFLFFRSSFLDCSSFPALNVSCGSDAWWSPFLIFMFRFQRLALLFAIAFLVVVVVHQPSMFFVCLFVFFVQII